MKPPRTVCNSDIGLMYNVRRLQNVSILKLTQTEEAALLSGWNFHEEQGHAHHQLIQWQLLENTNSTVKPRIIRF